MTNGMNNVNRIDVLVVEDDVAAATAIQRLLVRAGYTAVCAHTLAQGMALVDKCSPEIVLLDLSLPDGDGVATIQLMKTGGVGEVIIISGTEDSEKTYKCLQAGVFDFILKPASADDILRSVRRADATRRLKAVTPQSYPAHLKPGLGALEGVSVVGRQLLASIKKIAENIPVRALVTGQSGVQKADNAALIHHYSRQTGSALLINCASEDDERAVERFFGPQDRLGESDTTRAVEGYLAKADGGTLVLDDISALPQIVQRKLAHFIAAGESIASNASASLQYDCSIIGILREPVTQALSDGRFYEPLYYALSATTLVVPPLVERQEDIEHLARYAVEQLNRVFETEKSVSTAMIERLRAHYWPGNLVELTNLMLIAYRVTEPGEEIAADAVQFGGAEIHSDNKIAPFVGQTFRQVEAQLIEATLKAHGNNKSKSAKILGISLKTLYNRLNRNDEGVSSEQPANIQ